MPALVLTLAAATWLVLLLASPSGPAPLAALIYGVGSFVCHQLPERSFHLGEYQIPVCARCLGIYAGFACTACAHVAVAARSRAGGWRTLTPAVARRVFAASAVPTAMTLVLEWSDVWPGSNVVRAIAGVALGSGVAFVVMGAVATLHYNGCERPQPTGPSPQPPPI